MFWAAVNYNTRLVEMVGEVPDYDSTSTTFPDGFEIVLDVEENITPGNYYYVNNSFILQSPTYSIVDIIDAIKNNYTDEQENYIISRLPEYLTYVEDGTSYNIVEGDSTSILQWRTDNYASTFNIAQNILGKKTYLDSFNTLNYRSDFDIYNDIDTTGMNVVYDSEIWLSMEYTIPKNINLIKLTVDNENIKCYISVYLASNEWKYYAGTTTNHGVTTGILTEYDDTTSASEAYIDLDNGINRYSFPKDLQIKLCRIYFLTPDSQIDFNLTKFDLVQQVSADDLTAGTISTEYIVVTSPDGKTTFDGNTITIRDESNNIRVLLGRLN
jgi:hypothetical protein